MGNDFDARHVSPSAAICRMSSKERKDLLAPMLKGTVEETSNLSPEQFRARYSGRRPVVVRGACSTWPAVNWTLPDLASFATDRVLVRQCDNGIFADRGEAWKSQEVVSTDYFKMLEANGIANSYLVQPIAKYGAAAEALGWPEFAKGIEADGDLLWVGKNTYNQIHYHVCGDAFAAQLLGEKLFIMFDPESVRHLSYHPWYSKEYNKSTIPFATPGPHLFEEYPDLENAYAWECVLRPGDVLYVPNHWPHAVYCDQVAILWSTFWLARVRDFPLVSPGLRTLLSPALSGYVGTVLSKTVRRAIGR